jgi:sugar/nucleoside kinase (ribokinase family)
MHTTLKGLVATPEFDSAPTVVGIGALNLDLIATASKLSASLAEKVVESSARFEWNFEGTVDADTIERVLERIGSSSIDGALGGSAWNTIYALAEMDVGVSMGYVGVAGRTEFPGLSFIRQMDRLGIDHRFVNRTPDKRCGLCLSYIEDGERTLLTHAGANLAMADHIKGNFDILVTYLAASKAIHVTSFLDRESTEEVAKLLGAVKARSPGTLISVDPGHVWASDLSGPVRAILRTADYIFVNQREFKMLGRHEPGETDEGVAKKVFEVFGDDLTLLVAKRYDLIETFRGKDSRMVVVNAPSAVASLNDRNIEDATGAGDTFSAAVLAALTAGRLHTELGSLVGLTLSRYKLEGTKIAQSTLKPSFENGFLLFPHLTRVRAPAPRRVLLAHGESEDWEEVYRFLTQSCNLDVLDFDGEIGRTNSETLVTALSNSVEECGFAVCILAERTVDNATVRASQSVVQQAGIFQGRYGFGRVALLVQEGCEVLSNVAGIIRLDYRAGAVDRTFIELEQMFVREGVMPAASHPSRDINLL